MWEDPCGKAHSASLNLSVRHALVPLVACCLLSTTGSVLSAPPTPGAVQPDLERRTIPTAPDTSGFPIPPVIERPLGVDEGPRILVKAFAFEGVKDQPEYGIHKSEIEALAEKMRQAQNGQLTIGRLQEVANEITRYYRNAGFILAQAFVPEQTVQNDTVVIRVMEGRLDAIKVEGNELYSTDVLKLPFKGVIGEAVQKDKLESSLLYLTDYPGLNAFGVFKPGDEVGGTNLVLNVQEEERFEWALSGDNYGISSTGEWRALAEGHWNNVSGVGDRLSGAVLQTFDPTDSLYGSLDYRRPIMGPENTIGIGVSRNDYNIGQEFAVLGVDGTTDKAYINFRRSFIRSRNLNLYGLFEFNRQVATVDQISLEAEDNLSVAMFELGFDSIDTRFSGINQGSISYSHGFPDFLGSMDEEGNGKSLRIDGDGNHVGGDFDKLKGRLARLQAITKNQSVLFRLEGQYTNDVLSSLEQMSLGGPNSVRAYPVNEYLFDKALYASVEWIINAPGFSDKPAFANRTWGEVFQVSLFYDYGNGKLNNPTDYEKTEGTDDRTIHGVGGALQFNLPGQAYARLDVATRTSGIQPIGNDRDTQYWLTARYEF